GKIGVGGATNCSMEFTGSGIDALSVEDKMTICNMAIEAGGTNGIMEPNQEMINYVKARTSVPFEVIKSDANAKYKQIYNFKGSDIVPCVAQPHSPDKYAKVTDVSDVKLTRTYIGSCTGGKTSDFIAAAKILKGHKVNIETLIVPATVQVEKSLYTEKIDGVTLAEIFDKAGCVKPLAPGCQACLGGPQDTAGRANSKEVVVSTTNRNFIGRMGSKEAQIYLASPYTAAASAISGKIADPREYL
ncbi:MAG TPA: aconitase family protein, partial [Cellvibrionaceae bacterium]|nr:aconitase family protein [Cellvibrionaceae bacterium]